MLHDRFSYWTISDLFLAVGEIPAEFINFPANRFLYPVQCCNTNMADKNESESVKMINKRSFTNATECKYKFVYTELVQEFYTIKYISSSALEFELKKTTNNL